MREILRVFRECAESHREVQLGCSGLQWGWTLPNLLSARVSACTVAQAGGQGWIYV